MTQYSSMRLPEIVTTSFSRQRFSCICDFRRRTGNLERLSRRASIVSALTIQISAYQIECGVKSASPFRFDGCVDSWQRIVSAPKQTLDWHADCIELPTLAQRVFHHPAEALNAIRLTATDLGLLGPPDYSLTHSVTQSPARHSPQVL